MSDTPSFPAVLRNAIQSYLLDLHTSMPGQIVSYDRETQLARVKPCLRRTLNTGEELELPDIYNVPVQFPSSSNANIHFDLEEGDSVMIIFSERSLDGWVERGGCVTPKERRLHNINDAIAIPGVKPKPSSFSPKGDEGSLTICNNDVFIELKKDGKVVLDNGENELLSVLVELVTEMISGKNLTTGGPLGKDPIYIEKLNGILTKLQTFKA